MKFATWNINSIRARTERLTEWLAAHSPDVLLLQETKCVDEQFPFEAVAAAGYQAVHFGQKTYNGVAVLAKIGLTLSSIEKNLGDGDDQSRVIAAVVNGIRFVGVYAPNGQSVDSKAYHYKLGWYAKLQQWLSTRRDLPLVVGGDFNVAPNDIDVHDPALWAGQTLFTLAEREALERLRAGLALTDLFRAKHPAENKRFSWWDYRAGAFRRNNGLRIDHLLVSEPLVETCLAVDIDVEARRAESPSDHAPVWAHVS